MVLEKRSLQMGEKELQVRESRKDECSRWGVSFMYHVCGFPEGTDTSGVSFPLGDVREGEVQSYRVTVRDPELTVCPGEIPASCGLWTLL